MVVELGEDPSWVPDSCTLPTAALPLRQGEFGQLLRTGVTDQERTGAASLRLTLTAEPEIAAAAAALAVRESQCCGFFAFTLTIAAASVYLTVDVPPAQVEVLNALAQRVSAARP